MFDESDTDYTMQNGFVDESDTGYTGLSMIRNDGLMIRVLLV
jgi:hypothetical protein